jgi:hypothetical protein
MRAQIVHESPRRAVFRWGAAAGMAMAAVLALGACKATGGGQIDDPVPSGVLPTGDIDGAYNGVADFGFNFTCEMKSANRALIKGEITYHDTATSTVAGLHFPEIRLHGVVDPTFVTAPKCEDAAQMFLDAAQFQGDYQSQDVLLSAMPPGRFVVLVFDQGEPGRTKDPLFVNGDGFSIELTGGAYACYTRAGYIEGGNIQVS